MPVACSSRIWFKRLARLATSVPEGALRAALAVVLVAIGLSDSVNRCFDDLSDSINRRFDALRADHVRFAERLRAVEVAFGKVDQRLRTIERVVLPPASSGE